MRLTVFMPVYVIMLSNWFSKRRGLKVSGLMVGV